MRGAHGEKIIAAIQSEKMPKADVARLKEALSVYDSWIREIESSSAQTLKELISSLVSSLNKYKFYIDVNLIFDSKEDFLYRQKGQLKLDNSVMEEFLPLLVRKCLEFQFGEFNLYVGSQIPSFSSIFFASSLSNPGIGGGISLKTKCQDFSISRMLYLMSSYDPQFSEKTTTKLVTYLGYVLAELKTNLDKTMFQEASATAHDVKQAVTGAKYYLLCDFLDMTPISTATTDIDEILITRKAKRISSNIRKDYATFKGRQKRRKEYIEFLEAHPYAPEIFSRFIDHIFSQIQNENLIEESILDIGYF